LEKGIELSQEIAKHRTATKDIANIAVTDTVNVTVNDTDTVKVKDIKSNNTTTKKEKTFSGDVIKSYENCLTFFPEHLHPKKESQKNNWIDTIKKLNEIEKLPFSFIEDLTKKIRADDFWQKNFLSIPKLRKKNNEGVMYIIVFNERFNSTTVNKKNKQIENIKANLENW
jgi:hypothetical protein